jgi:pyruvate dehydrogenase E1 component alpha subunit
MRIAELAYEADQRNVMAAQPSATQTGADQTGRSAFPGDEPVQVLRDYYRQMVLIRAFEQCAAEMYQRAKIGGYCHLNLGEEATVVGLMAALQPRDYLFTTYREHGYALARGLEPGPVMAELFGKTTGVSAGRGGSMHLFDEKRRLLGGYGIVGGQIPPATGAALALTYRGEPGPEAEAVMCLLGDGATNIGAFHESLNLAALWQLPIVYVIVNNGLGMGTPVEKASAEPDLYKRGCSYRIPGERVDGDDVLAVRDAAHAALTRARTQRQPGLLETVSYRLRGHSVVDPAKYRTKEETDRLRRPRRGRSTQPPTRRSTPPWPSPRRAPSRNPINCSPTPTRHRCPTHRISCPATPSSRPDRRRAHPWRSSATGRRCTTRCALSCCATSRCS